MTSIMTTHFITAELELPTSPEQLLPTIVQELSKQGQPLRWAITQVDQAKQTAHIEAVVTRSSR
jgi:CRISPR/Cas system endoribonuclease Cas6 (RAMP superfamily)